MCVPRDSRWCFVQDLEWHFVRNPVIKSLLKHMILFSYRRSRLISANSYLTVELIKLGLPVEAQASIWAAPMFMTFDNAMRDISLVMVLRKGDHKRLDLYMDFLHLQHLQGRSWKIAVITPEDEIAGRVGNLVDECVVRPDIEAMRQLYARSKCFLHFSEHEGFGLPPLEAMGSGCVPLCRDSGGIRAYLTGELTQLIMPKSFGISEVVDRVVQLLEDPEQLQVLSRKVVKVFADGVACSRNRSNELSRLQFS